MAKIGNGYLGGFNGVLGPAIGYLWNGKWCVRSRPGQVRNPRTDKQMACRQGFAAEVRLAAAMRWGVNAGLTAAARQSGMTAYNLFVSLNQEAFSFGGGQLGVDWARLQLSVGPVATVALEEPQVEEGNVLSVSFEKNPEHRQAGGFDQVRLYVYCPELGQGYLSAPVYRRTRRLSVSLPDGMAGREVQLYAWVEDEQGRLSPTVYGGAVVLAAAPAAAVTPALPAGSAADTTAAPQGNPLATSAEPLPEADEAPRLAGPPVVQLSLW